ncbi:MAG: hypothetical protein JSU00_07820 [Acidobacteria bacterium]|nr:hypothetical protein [Acidobacteriota bacterium]
MPKPVSARRRKTQGGQEIIEFALVAIILIPLLIGSVVTGVNMIRSTQAQQVCRDLDSIYIHGGDFSVYSMQQLAQRLARGLNLQIGASFTGNQATNTGNGGDGLVTVSQITYVGPTTASICTAVGAANCVNHDSFVYTQRIRFGNGALVGQSTAALGDPTTTSISASGLVLNPYTDSGAKVPGASQTQLQNLWQVSGGGRTPLVDGQVMYIVEFYLQPPGISIGSFSMGAIYTRYYF